MFVVLLKFGANRGQAGTFAEAHKAWLKRGFADGVFLLAGSLQPGAGGAILARGLSRVDLESRLSEDPFVAEQVVSAEILELSPALADRRLDFLVDAA